MGTNCKPIPLPFRGHWGIFGEWNIFICRQLERNVLELLIITLHIFHRESQYCESCRCVATFNGNLLLEKIKETSGETCAALRMTPQRSLSNPIGRERTSRCTDRCFDDKHHTRASSSQLDHKLRVGSCQRTRNRCKMKMLEQSRTAGAARGLGMDQRTAENDSRRC